MPGAPVASSGAVASPTSYADAMAAWPPRRRLAAAGLAGAALSLAQPPFGLWPVLFVAGPLIFLLWRAAGASPSPGRAAFLVGWAAGAGFFAAALHWIVEPFLVDAARHGWMAPFALVLLSGGLALFWGGAFWLARRLDRLIGGPLALAALWAGAEFARSYVLTGFPWALPVYAWTGTPVAQVSALVGPYGLSFLTLAAMTGPAALFTGARGARRFAPALAAAALLALGWGWGAARINGATPPGGPEIRILQTAVDQREKWAGENVGPNLRMLMDLSTRPAATPPAVPPKIIVWPETATTVLIDADDRSRAAIRAELDAAFAGEPGRGPAVALGSLRRAPDGPRNSVFLLEAGGGLSAPFDKIHLVPFGEYMPLEGLLQRIGLGGLAGLAGGLTPGSAHRVIAPGGAPPFAPLICYEMIFPRETAAAADGAAWMTLATNDAWFGRWAGPEQHFAMARMRAIETGLPIARSANIGHSAMIDPYGRASELIEIGGAGVIDARLPDSVSPPPYRRWGEVFTTFMICAALGVATSDRRRAPS